MQQVYYAMSANSPLQITHFSFNRISSRIPFRAFMTAAATVLVNRQEAETELLRQTQNLPHPFAVHHPTTMHNYATINYKGLWAAIAFVCYNIMD